MKQFLMALLCSLISFAGLSQNGGQNSENNVLKITYTGWSNGEHIVTLQNKVNCSIVATYNFDGVTVDVTIPALSSVVLTKAAPQSSTLNAKARRKSGANCISSPDNGWVEITTTGVVLPIRFISFAARRLSSGAIQITFTCEEDNTIDRYKVKVSLDAETWKEVLLIFPNGIQGLKTYTATIKY